MLSFGVMKSTLGYSRLHLASALIDLVNGLDGDPLLHVRLQQARRSLLFDLGDSHRLRARDPQQVIDEIAAVYPNVIRPCVACDSGRA